MSWRPGQAMLRKEGGVWKQNPQILMVPERESFISFKDDRKLTRYLKDHGLEEDTRPHVTGTMTKHKRKRKVNVKGGGEKSNGKSMDQE